MLWFAFHISLYVLGKMNCEEKFSSDGREKIQEANTVIKARRAKEVN